jgi:hypothetical protein
MPISTDRFYSYNTDTVSHRGKNVKNILGSTKWGGVTDYVNGFPAKLANVPVGMEGRPDLIASDVYGNSYYWWVICVANNVIDPFEQLKAGKLIKIPQIFI